ncbi:MAG: CheR family methyltransferase [Gemmatimonadaceae bacterium]
MTSLVASRPFVVATVLFDTNEADSVRALLEAIAPDQGVSFVLLEEDGLADVDRDSFRSRAIGTTRLNVGIAAHDGIVEANAAYFLARKSVHELRDSTFHFASDGHVSPGDVSAFLISVAADQGRRSCVIVFASALGEESASASGMRRIAEAGGLVLVQNEPGGSFRRIMRWAEEAEPVVARVTVAELPAVVLEHAEPLIAEGRPRTTSALYEDVEEVLPALCGVLREVTGNDFAEYKPSTLVRRTLRRMHLVRIYSAKDYLDRVTNDRAEAERLFNDLLVSVTAFFRDTDAFKSLTTVIPKIFSAHAPNESVRIWVAGCATGEEAYSMAMLFREVADEIKAVNPIQIFATDLDDRALSVARRGRYPAARLAHVSPERIERFFTRSGTSFQVTKEIRDLVLFTRHNVINDPPFSNADLVSCRNLLIYLGEELYQRVIPLFHYALRPNGFLFLGPAESLTTHQDLFQPVDVKHRISVRIGTSKRLPPIRLRHSSLSSFPSTNGASGESEILRSMQQQLADGYTPKGLVVNDEGQVVAVSDGLEEYLTVSAGSFVNSVTRLVQEGLRMPVRAALRESVALNKRVVHHGGTLETHDGLQRITVTVDPMEAANSTAGLFLIVFQPAGHPVSANSANALQGAGSQAAFHDSETSFALIERLEFDLASTREELHRTVQDLEAVNEELKSSNEELLSMNEELQSSNEELETSKDELQGSNESLELTNSDLTNLLISTQIPTVFLDNDGKVRRVTPTASAIYNLFPNDVGRPLEHFTHKAEFMPPLPNADVVHKAERAIETDVRMRDGTLYVRRVLPYLTTDGRLDGIVVTFTDVSEARRSVEAELSSERRFRQLAETIPHLAWMADSTGSIFWYNQRWYDYTGTKFEDMQGWGWTRVHDPELLPAVKERWRNSISSGDTFNMVFPLLGKDGQYRPFLTRVNPFRDEHGFIKLWFGTNTDLTEERATAATLERRQRELQTLADNSPDVLTRFDKTLRHVFVSAAIETATGLKPSAYVGKTHREMGTPEPLAAHWELQIKKVFATGQHQRTEFSIETPTGLRHYTGLLVPELDQQGNVEFVLSFAHDSTSEREAEDELRDANRRKDEFLATLAHELRNPLAPVRNGLELLRPATSMDAAVEAVRVMMERQIVNMTRLIDDLLDISRVSLGKVELKLKPVSIQSIIAGAVEVIRPAIESAKHELRLRVPESDLIVVADSTRLIQVVGNLLHNAAKYTPDAGRITLDVARDGKEVVIRITDNGIGIPSGMLVRIFEKFAQIDYTIERSRDGLGIGLSLAKQLVLLHEGTIRAESGGPNMGSTFTVLLPVASDIEQIATNDADFADDIAKITRPLQILVVDDNVEAAQSFAKILQAHGHQAIPAFSATEAMRTLDDSLPDVAFLDIGLPDIDGFKLASRIRRKAGGERVVLVALTGWGSEQHRRRSSEAGFDFHLAKPADMAEIRRILSGVGAK